MLGSRLGGVTEPRGSTPLLGVCWIPGSIWDGGIAGTPDSDGFSGVMRGALSLLGDWPGGDTSAAMANAGKRVRKASTTSR